MPTSDVDRYVRAAPDDVRPFIEEIRALIRREAPGLTEQMSPNGFAIYTAPEDPKAWRCGFAYPKKGPMLYVMGGALERHAERLGRLRTGKSCVLWKASKTLSLDELRDLARTIVREAVQ